MKKTAIDKSKAVQLQPIKMTIEIPSGGLQILLYDQNKCVGTIHVGGQGISYNPPRSKKPLRSLIPWDTLKKLMFLGC